ncbi:MAG: sterol desaturase family protein [Pseudomonadota bacterium]
MELIIAKEPLIRFGAFGGCFALFAIWELYRARRPRKQNWGSRWLNNCGILVVDVLIVRLAAPLLPLGAALITEHHEWGLFNVIELPSPASLIVGFLLLDFAIYLQHRAFHALPWCWRLHRVHHADLAFDVTTGVRFHPLEIVLSTLIKILLVILLGAPASLIVIFEVVLNGTSLFNHANISMPAGLDAVLRRFVVTPDMHRVHHSAVDREMNSNFGFNLPWWDHWLGTYRAQPEGGHLSMTVGLEAFRDQSETRLDKMLLQPFR